VSEDAVLAVDRLETHFYTLSSSVAAVDGVSFELRKVEAPGSSAGARGRPLSAASGCGSIRHLR